MMERFVYVPSHHTPSYITSPTIAIYLPAISTSLIPPSEPLYSRLVYRRYPAKALVSLLCYNYS